MLRRKEIATQKLFHVQPSPLKYHAGGDGRHQPDQNENLMQYFDKGNPTPKHEPKCLVHDSDLWYEQGRTDVSFSSFIYSDTN